MPLIIPKFADSKEFQKEIETLLRSLSKEFNLTQDNLPIVLGFVFEVVANVEVSYGKLIKLLEKNYAKDTTELREKIFRLELISGINSKISNN